MELGNLENYFSPEIISIFAEINAPRSAYQIEKFVLGQHDTEEMRYYQCVLELHNLYFAIKRNALGVKKTELEIKNLRATGNEIDEIDAQIKELDLESLRSVAVSAFNEYDILMELFNSFPKYTRQQIDEAQPEYWQRRLTRQYELASSTNTANQAAHLDSLLQIGAVVREVIPLTDESTKEIQGENK
jgi:hypothetical protein